MIMDIKESINDTRKSFEESFATGDFYNRQTQDSEHLEKILGIVRISDGMRILDLGTGRGYLESDIRFPKKKDTAFGYEEVLRKHDKTVIDSYDLVETETELYITERVCNVL